MATIFLDGFDKYGPPGENSPNLFTLFQQTEWTTFSSGSIVAGLSSSGYAIQFAVQATGPTKTLSTTYTRLIGGLRFNAFSSLSNQDKTCLIGFANGGTQTCSLQLNTVGQILFRTGGQTGGGITTSSVSVSVGSTHYLEWDITFGAAGAYTLYLDGVSIASATGNTGNGQTVSNKILLAGDTNSTNPVTIDDFYLFDTTTLFNKAPLLSNPQIITQYPSGDSQTQWTNAGNVLVPISLAMTGVSNTTGNTNAPGANELALVKITPGATCNLQSVGLLPQQTNAGAKFKSVLYADSAGAPGALTATGNEVIGCTAGVTLTLAFASGQTLTGGTTYWVGFITDTSIALGQYDATTNLGQKKAITYPTAPNPASTMVTAQATWQIWGNATGATTNWESVDFNPPNGTGPSADSSTLTSSTVGNEDLYSFPALPGNITTVYTIGVKGNIKKSDTGTRLIDMRTSSLGTDSAGSTSAIVPATTYGWLDSYFDTDPHTNGTWSPGTINTAICGPKVNS